MSALFALSVLQSWGNSQDTSREIQDHFLAAQRYQNAGQLDNAVREYQAVLQFDQQIAEVYADLGFVYLAQGKALDSAHALETARRLKPSMHGVSLCLGIDYVKLGKPQSALPVLQSAVQADPKDGQAQRWLGTALWDTGRTSAALDRMRKAEELSPSDLEIRFILGEAYRKAADQQTKGLLSAATNTALFDEILADSYKDEEAWSKALEHYQIALKKDPSLRGVHLGLGELLAATGKLKDARRELTLAPRSAAAAANLAQLDLIEQKVPEALQLLDTALNYCREETTFTLGFPATFSGPKPYFRAEELEKIRTARNALQDEPAGPSQTLALAFTDKLLDMDSFQDEWRTFAGTKSEGHFPGSILDRGRRAYYQKRYEEARVLLETWLQASPHDLRASELLANILRNLSLEELAELIEAAPESYLTHQLLAQIYESQKNSDRAIAEYRVVEKMKPSLPEIHLSLGRLLWENGDPDGAVQELTEALNLEPTEPNANALLGQILVVQHQPDKAIPYLQMTLKEIPNSLVAHQQLGKAYMLKKEYQLAEVELKQTIQVDKDGAAHYQLGMVYQAEGRTKAARVQFDIAARIKATSLNAMTGDRGRPSSP
jgi:tetratricopeptide (TPR) repeat protein